MNAQRQEQIKQIFLNACEMQHSLVAAYLDDACAGDSELRLEVESLLAHHLPATIIGQASASTGHEEAIPGVWPTGIADAHPPSSAPAARPHERFPPGTMLAGRYRMLAPLGRGGMGEVFRADDLKLDQPVALKFLPRQHSEDPAWLDRYCNEVRLARRVTHPNVTRVYDIGEVGDDVFISMEYVDGEDLASLLRRIRRITSDKAIEIARQLCAGLGAAHDQGVLHRDLKPANVMIDARGRVRITDFGIAALGAQTEPRAPQPGTPAYMAPELFAGDSASVQSDLYSLGLLLYEMVTGSEPFPRQSLLGAHEVPIPIAPSSLVPEVDPRLESVILSCLERHPKNRPDSAYAVAAALPGGDCLQAALAAGHTPSPTLVAAAGPHHGLRPRTAISLFAASAIALTAVVFLADHTMLLPQAGLDKPALVLADRAQQIITRLGYEPIPAGRWQGFSIDRSCLDYLETHRAELDVSSFLHNGRPPAVFFWYREGDNRLTAPPPVFESMAPRLLPPEPGMHTVFLDGQGRLLRFTTTPYRDGFNATPSPQPQWSVPFDMAGLAIRDFRPVPPPRRPPAYADTVAAWEGSAPEDPHLLLHVEGASLQGKVVNFEVVSPWNLTPSATAPATWLTRSPSRGFVARLLLYLVALFGGVALAWRNVRLGRGDQRGARRLALIVLVLGMVDWLLGERHVAVPAEELASFYLWTGRAILAAGTTWICYLAVESYGRRIWPQTMITWSRALRGNFLDPLLGRDLLLGALAGIALVLLVQAEIGLSTWSRLPQPLPKLPGPSFDLGVLLGLRYKASVVVGVLLVSFQSSLVLFVVLLVLRALVYSSRLASFSLWAVLTAFIASTAHYDTFLPWVTSSIFALALVLLLTRLGLVAVSTALGVWYLLVVSPVTADLRAWYAPAGLFAILGVAALLVYASLTAAQGRLLLPGRRFYSPPA